MKLLNIFGSGIILRPVNAENEIKKLLEKSKTKEAYSIFFLNVHSLVEGMLNGKMRHALVSASLLIPDGMPIALLMKGINKSQKRIAGPDFFVNYLFAANALGESIYLLGSTKENISGLMDFISSRYDQIKVVGWSTPALNINQLERNDIIEDIKISNPNSVWVSFGCPKQELWVSKNIAKINRPVFAVGAAFDFIGGGKPRAPEWVRKYGMEWIHRLFSEPKRLMWRYLKTNTLFVYYLITRRSSTIERKF